MRTRGEANESNNTARCGVDGTALFTRWGGQDVEFPRGIMDCTNTHMEAGPDYMRETYNLYRALAQDLNIPVEFLDEDQLLLPAALGQ